MGLLSNARTIFVLHLFVLTLKVRENIHLFGGDKDQITIFGHSAGSWSVSAHLLSPLSEGLFKRAIMQSGAHFNNKDRPILTKEEALQKARNLAKRANCSNDKQWLECLRKVEANHFIIGTDELTYPLDGTPILPLSTQKAFNTRKFNKGLDLLAGVARDEGSYLPLLFLNKLIFNATKEDFIEMVNSSVAIFHNLDFESIKDFYLKNVNEKRF